jgi:hypothetical protein
MTALPNLDFWFGSIRRIGWARIFKGRLSAAVDFLLRERSSNRASVVYLGKSDWPFCGWRRIHHLANRRQNTGNRAIMR